MQIILLEKVKNLGGLGDTVDVKPGFARNFLIPSGKAVSANDANMAEFESRRAELEQQQAEVVNAAKARAVKLEDLTIVIAHRAGEEGVPHAGAIRPTPGQQRTAGRRARWRDVVVFQPHGLLRQLVDVRGLDDGISGESDVAVTLIIGDDEDDVGLVSGTCRKGQIEKQQPDDFPSIDHIFLG